jgi:hypothetical protein
MATFKIIDEKLVKTETQEEAFSIDEINAKIETFTSEIQSAENSIAGYQTELDKWQAMKTEYENLI